MAGSSGERGYEILDRLAVGGMAELFLARARGPEGFQKLVVLKRPLPQLASDREFARMFLEEARLAATLDHSNIAHVYDFGVSEGRYFFAMEYVHGEDLRSILNRAHLAGRVLPIELAVAIAIGVAAGLHYAHERRDPAGRPLEIVHRDVSPSNVLVSYDGCPKIVDFGVAKAACHMPTTGGRMKGKLSYMSPEQAEGRQIDRRSDVFSLGILLYETTTGSRLFRGSEDDTIHRILTADVPLPSARRQDYPRDLEPIVLRALELDPARRHPTAQDLQVELEDWARRGQRNVSSTALARFMEDVFGQKIEAWREARRRGVELADHVTQTLSRKEVPTLAGVAPPPTPLPLVVEPPAAAPLSGSAGAPRWQVLLAALLVGAGLAIAAWALWRGSSDGPTLLRSRPALRPAVPRAASSGAAEPVTADAVASPEPEASPAPVSGRQSVPPRVVRVRKVAAPPVDPDSPLPFRRRSP